MKTQRYKLVTKKQEGVIWYQNHTIIQQNYFQKMHQPQKWKKKQTKKNTHTHTQVIKNKLVYLTLSIHKTRKIVMHEFWCDYVKPKNG